MITQDAIRAQLSTVKYPGFSRDIVSFGLVKDVRIDGADVGGLATACARAIALVDGVGARV